MTKLFQEPDHSQMLAGSIVARVLQRGWVKDAVVCPGSRSAPLAIAMAREPGLRVHSVLDERSAGFFALGLAKAQGCPVALVCTSGTAAANFLPAVVEARHGHVPLIVMTADRPPEMRDCHVGQTIDQVKLFGTAVRYYNELAVPESGDSYGHYLRQVIEHSLRMTMDPEAGPVHLNFPFREPLWLPPGQENRAMLEEMTRCIAGDSGARIFVQRAGGHSFTAFPEIKAWEALFQTFRRPLVVVGSGDGPGFDEAARALARFALRWRIPVFADALNGVRNCFFGEEGIIRFYDSILRNGGDAGLEVPDLWITLGPLPTSKVLRDFMRRSGAPMMQVMTSGDDTNALRLPVWGRVGAAYLARLAEASLPEPSWTGPWVGPWVERDRAVEKYFGKAFGDESPPAMESGWAWNLADWLPCPVRVFVSNSNPVRDFEFFWRGHAFVEWVYCNRGANGIDGVFSSALGVAAMGSTPVILITGDLAFLHDIGALAIAGQQDYSGRLIVLLVDNHGGGIFEHLPVSAHEDVFEPFFATPRTVDVGMVCAAFGVGYVACRTWQEIGAAIRQLLAEPVNPPVSIVHIRTDRKAGAAMRSALAAQRDCCE